MCPTLRHDDALDQAAACRARSSILLVDAKTVLIIATPIDPINAGAVASQTLAQGFPQAAPQAMSLPLGEFGCQVAWMQLGAVEGLIGVDIPHPSKELLIHQKRFERPAPPGEHAEEGFGTEAAVQGLRSQGTEDLICILQQKDLAEFAGIGEAQLPMIVELKNGMFKAPRWCAGGGKQQIAAHPQVDEHRLIVQRKNQVLPAPLNIEDRPAADLLLEDLRFRMGNVPRPAKDHPADGSAGEGWRVSAQGAGDRLYLRELGHLRAL